MPSRAAVSGAGAFSYYDHVFLPENQKDLVWAMGGRSFRSQVVIRLQGRRRTEAFLFEMSEAGAWRPVALDDGTVSDGKVETYTRCVERLCGSADTIFTSMFGAQGKRQLSDYRNAEIKTLLADLLCQDAILALGRKAGETAKLLKAGLVARRQELDELDAERDRLEGVRAAASDAPARAAQARAALAQAGNALETARQACARLVARQERCRGDDARRAQLRIEREAAQASARTAAQALDAQERSERQRLERLAQRCRQFASEVAARRQRLQRAQADCLTALAREGDVRRAMRRRALADELLLQRDERVRGSRTRAAAWSQAQAAMGLLSQRVQGIEREAGQAALQAQALAQRFGLTGEVPCSGSDLQGRCKLLGDARAAQALMPSAQAALQRLVRERKQTETEARQARARVEQLAPAERELATAERRLERTRRSAARLALLAAKAPEMEAARARLADVQTELNGLEAAPGGTGLAPSPAEHEEREAIAAALAAIGAQRDGQAEQLRQTLARLDAVQAALPPPFDARALGDAEAARDRAVAAHAAAEREQLEMLRHAQVLATTTRELALLADRRAASVQRTRRIEDSVGDWTLLARCMSHDGLVALAIDDAGPALSALTNDLLLACYGPRFTVSILTQTATAKGERREDFDIVVHDAEADESKSVRLMSGGERVWISCRSRHEIHYAENLDVPSSQSGQRARPCNCPAGTCEAMRHNTAGPAAISSNARGGKSLSLMSGGERTFIDACLTRAIALYLAQNTGRRFDTLFSDEADGPLDPDHKRMFMAMKREVFRLGGYRQEFFITQTPHLAAMADAIIDLDAMQADARPGADAALG